VLLGAGAGECFVAVGERVGFMRDIRVMLCLVLSGIVLLGDVPTLCAVLRCTWRCYDDQLTATR